MVLGAWLLAFVLCNHLNNHEERWHLLHKCLPPLLAFFFFSTGSTMRVHALRRTWPAALALFGARLIALWCGVLTGTMCAEAAGLVPYRHAGRVSSPRAATMSPPIFADQKVLRMGGLRHD